MELFAGRAKHALLFIVLITSHFHILEGAPTGFIVSRSSNSDEAGFLQSQITFNRYAKKAYWALFTAVSLGAAYTALERCENECGASDYLGAGACTLGGLLPWTDDLFNSGIEAASKSLAALSKDVDKKED